MMIRVEQYSTKFCLFFFGILPFKIFQNNLNRQLWWDRRMPKSQTYWRQPQIPGMTNLDPHYCLDPPFVKMARIRYIMLHWEAQSGNNVLCQKRLFVCDGLCFPILKRHSININKTSAFPALDSLIHCSAFWWKVVSLSEISEPSKKSGVLEYTDSQQSLPVLNFLLLNFLI